MHFMAMEIVKGVTLDVALGAKMLNLKQLAELFLGAAEAFECAHAKHMTNARIIPSDIQVELPSRAVISFHDLALTVNPKDEKAKENLVAAAAYLSPEQVPGSDEPVDELTDIYRLGVIMYESMTGRAAFSGSTQAELHRKIYQENVPAPASVNKTIEPELDSIIQKAMHRARELRYQTATELAGALRHYLKRDAKPASPTTRKRIPTTFKMRTQIWFAKNRRKVQVGVVLGILFLVLGGGAGWQLYQKHLKEQEFIRAYKSALQFNQEGKPVEALDACNRALLIKTTPESLQLAVDCRVKILEGQVQKKIAELEAASYGPAIEAPAYELRRSALEKQLPELAAVAAESKDVSLQRIISLLGTVSLLLGDAEGAEGPLQRAVGMGPTEPKVPVTLARSYFLRILCATAISSGSSVKTDRVLSVNDLLSRMGEALQRPVAAVRTAQDEEVSDIYKA